MLKNVYSVRACHIVVAILSTGNIKSDHVPCLQRLKQVLLGIEPESGKNI